MVSEPGAPPRRTLPQCRDELWLTALKLCLQCPSEDAVDPEPMALAVERDDEEIRPLQPFEHVRGAGRLGDGVTQRAGESLENGYAGEELHFFVRHTRE